ncbi:hypothetical protein G6F56_012142 [Rhizopus delemar]|nr:hypothetical protein G6F56_012142 [Rhizopus delemar]
MGRSGAGKTSMRSIIFHNNIARDTRDIEPTILWNNDTHVQFLGDLNINIWDCGGTDLDKDIHYYQSCLELILRHSSNAKVFCLMHKADLIPDDKREKTFEKQRLELFVRSEPIQIQVFQTSIWDESLYAASLVKNHKLSFT